MSLKPRELKSREWNEVGGVERRGRTKSGYRMSHLFDLQQTFVEVPGTVVSKHPSHTGHVFWCMSDVHGLCVLRKPQRNG